MKVASISLTALCSTFQGFRNHFHLLTLNVNGTTRQISSFSAHHRQGSHDLTLYFRQLVEQFFLDDLHLLRVWGFFVVSLGFLNPKSCKTLLR